MAQSPAHRFGQIIGEVLEAAVGPILQAFAKKHKLYLDLKGPRPCRKGKLCKWVDHNGNSHDLDFVLERGGSQNERGTPAAFIETAWRRYTKHSRNKAQEIQGAIEPLAATYQAAGPFKGAVLAGVFTDGALTQLRSLGFTVLYFAYEDVIAVFQKFGVDATFDKSTRDAEFAEKVATFEALSDADKLRLAKALIAKRRADVTAFMRSLEAVVLRQIERIVILALHGVMHETPTVDDAITFIADFQGDASKKAIERYEIEIRYNNGNKITGSFGDKQSAIEFLRGYQPVTPEIV